MNRNARKMRLSHARSGTRWPTHVPKTASPEANRPPNTTSATSEIAAVRSTGHSSRWLLSAEIVLPSSGSPRTAESTHDAAPATTGTIRRASVSAVVTSTPTTTSASTVSQPASRSTRNEPRPRQSTVESTVHGLVRRGDMLSTSPPPRSRTSSAPSPMLRYGSTVAARAPMAADTNSGTGAVVSPRSGHTSSMRPATAEAGRAWTAPAEAWAVARDVDGVPPADGDGDGDGAGVADMGFSSWRDGRAALGGAVGTTRFGGSGARVALGGAVRATGFRGSTARVDRKSVV